MSAPSQCDFFRPALEQQFQQFHAKNPHVYEALRTRALRAKRKGFRPGIGCLFEVLRWSYGLTTEGDDFKLNNNYRAFYARMLMDQEPELEGFFELRRQRAA